jgi:competence protein ComEC
MDQNVETLEFVLATHLHADHIGGLVGVLNNIPTKWVITNGDMHTTLTFENFLDAIASSGAAYIEVKRGDEIRFGTLTFFVLNPGHALANDLDQNSIVMRLSYGTTTFLFTGDATSETENAMISENCLLKADILKVAHHGSRTSTAPEFIRAVRPKIAVYSAGYENLYGHPHPETIRTLEEAGVVIYGTDVYGSITFIVNKEGYRFVTENSRQYNESLD